MGMGVASGSPVVGGLILPRRRRPCSALRHSGNSLDPDHRMPQYRSPMARKLLTEQTPRGIAHAVLGLPACQSGRSLSERRPACRGDAEPGSPGMSW
jgi:hypothetical protein